MAGRSVLRAEFQIVDGRITASDFASILKLSMNGVFQDWLTANPGDQRLSGFLI
jgi:hypothetical protein